MNNLEKIRGSKGLTQDKLGKMAGVTRAAVCSIEKSKMNGEQAVLYGKLLEVNPFELIGTDVLRLMPKTQEDKEVLMRVIDSIKVGE